MTKFKVIALVRTRNARPAVIARVLDATDEEDAKRRFKQRFTVLHFKSTTKVSS